MASDSNGSSMSSWQFMALLAAAMGAFLTSAKLGSPFPSAVEPASDKGILVDAHLADDPFGAWVRAARKSDSGGDVPPPGVNGGRLPGPMMSAEGFKRMLPPAFTIEPPGFHLHCWLPGAGFGTLVHRFLGTDHFRRIHVIHDGL